MDSEHSFDSDISESWSLIDINDSEPANEADEFDTNTIIPVRNERSTSDSISDEIGGVDLHHGNADQGINTENCSNNAQSTESASVEHPNVHEDCEVLYKGKVFQYDYALTGTSSDFNCSRSNIGEAEKEIDSESKVSLSDIDNDIEVISLISESECNDLKLSADETDEIWEERLLESNTLGKPQPNVLKRKRKRLKLNYRGSSEESINSDFMVCDRNYNSNIENSDSKECDNELLVAQCQSAPVYRHYRNNVANTVLTLAMGVIFTGVACIAVGHFLGVHDAQQTAGEMMETLKRLQMENVLLHTRMAQLSRAFFSRGSSKLEFRANVEPKNCLDKYLHENVNENNVNDDIPIKNSIFFRGGSFDISTNMKEPSSDISNNINVIGGNHDQLNFFNVTKYEESYSKTPFSSTTPVKVGYVENKFANKLGEDTQTPDTKTWKLSPESKNCLESDEQLENGHDCLAVREKDLSRFRWFLLQAEKNRKNEDNEEVYVYKFPQPEGFYKYEEGNDETAEERLKLEEMCDELKVIRYPKDKNTKRKEVKLEEKRNKKEKKKNDDGKNDESVKKREKRNGNSPRKTKDNEDNYAKGSKKLKTEKNGKTKECKKKGDRECNFKPHSKKSNNSTERKRDEEGRKGRNKEKFLKGEKVKKMTMEKETHSRLGKRNFRDKKGFNDMKLGNGSDCESCGNKTAGWFYKWAKGRERCRRDQKISDWQFDRAKSRAASRIGDAHWQFSRALARESSRNEGYIHLRKRDAKHKGFSSDAYSWI